MTITIRLRRSNSTRTEGERVVRRALARDPGAENATIYAYTTAFTTDSFVEGFFEALADAGIRRAHVYGAGDRLKTLLDWHVENADSPFLITHGTERQAWWWAWVSLVRGAGPHGQRRDPWFERLGHAWRGTFGRRPPEQ
ncbi:hypothetical protein D9V34_15575 [Mycetocola lacteus]|uniref:Uncharacterized protein n=1 Tax=Mycetocola lacteus TaxID=76637 RepID=A0A3L7AIH7_9MICO|nr:hypothetical protein [Mycetocola lacteus]RLP79222.1 hypothetical protein D9V34_15575 [Mycetocola lacteus]